MMERGNSRECENLTPRLAVDIVLLGQIEDGLIQLVQFLRDEVPFLLADVFHLAGEIHGSPQSAKTVHDIQQGLVHGSKEVTTAIAKKIDLPTSGHNHSHVAENILHCR